MSVRGVMAATLLCGSALSASVAAHEWGGSLVLASDYVFRGQTHSQGDPVLQGGLHWRSDADWFAGAWASMVELNAASGPSSEVNLFAGRGWQVGQDWHARLIAVSYIYPQDSRLEWDYEEVLAALAFRDFVTASIAWSPNTTRFSSRGVAKEREALAYELTAQLPWRAAWTLTGGIGYYDLDQLFGTGYTYWSGGLTYAADPWQLALTRTGTSAEAESLFGHDTTADRWALSARWQFGGPRR